MQITEVRVFPVDEDKLKAFASIVIEDAFVVSDIKIIEGRHGRFLSMPSTKRKNGTFRDIAHPLNQDTRMQLEKRIFDRYDEIMNSEERAIVDEVLTEEGVATSRPDSPRLPVPPGTVRERVGLGN